MKFNQDMKNLTPFVLILVCALFIAADDSQKPSFDTHETVAKAYYDAQVQKAAKEKVGRRDSGAMPKMATGVVVDRQRKGIFGASILVKDEVADTVLGKGAADATGRFQITLSEQSYQGLTLTVTKDGFTRWAQAGFYGGIVGYQVRLDREIDDGFFKSLIDEKEQELRLWTLLEIVGDRQFATEMSNIFPHIGALRDDLLSVVQSKAFETKDGKQSSPADRARSLLAYWHDPADEAIFGRWLKNKKYIKHPMDKKFVGKTITKVCKQWADHHFDNEKPKDRTFNSFNEPLLDPSGTHALVQFWVEYKIWGYSQVLVLTKQQSEWQLEFVAKGEHWHKQPNVEDKWDGWPITTSRSVRRW